MPDEYLSTEESCPTCGAAIDTTGLEPLTPIGCPNCGQEILAGKIFGDYELIQVMGRGGMGVVYRAMDLALARPVALKLLRPEQAQEDVLSKLEQEAAVTASINHPHVVKVFTTGTFQGRFFIAMELVDKGTLDDLIELQGRIAEAQALEVASQIAQGLRAAYQHGLIHRDVKPGNILFSDAHSAKIVDFGLAIMEEASAAGGEIWGTPYYVSPERLDQKPEDFRSDMYSLGATIFHAIAGRPPFEAEDATMVALKHLKSQAVSLQAFAPWVSGSTAFVINRTLQKNPDDRYASYDELIEHLEYARHELISGEAKPVEKKRMILETDEDRRRQGLIVTALIGFVLLSGVAAGAYFYFGNSDDQNIQGPPATASVGASGALAERYEKARQLLLHDEPKNAAPAFLQLANDSGTPNRLAHWCRLQAGIAYLLTGNTAEARTVFAGLKEKPFKGKDQKLREFFEKAATLGMSDSAIPPESLQGTDRQSYPSLLLLIAGIKDWEFGKFEESATLLREFQAMDPRAQFVWLTEYKGLAGDYVSDYADYHGALELAKNAHSVSELEKAAVSLRKLKGDLKRGGALAESLEKAAAAASDAAREKTKQQQAQVDAEKKALTDARNKATALLREGTMKEARSTLETAKLNLPETRRDQQALLRKVGWLAQFQEQLIADLAKHPGGIVSGKDGKEIAGKVARGTADGLEFDGAPARKWADLSPASIRALAESLITPDLSPGEAASRRWHAGVFAAFHGQKREAHTLLTEAAKEPLWATYLGWIIPLKRGNVAKGKPVTASDSASNGSGNNAASRAVDGDWNTKWTDKETGVKWLQVDLGKEVVIDRWQVKHSSAKGQWSDTNTANFALQRLSAADGEAVEIDQVRGNTLDTTDRRVAPFTARYVRLAITKAGKKTPEPPAQIGEFELYNVDASADPVGDLLAAPIPPLIPEFASRDLGLSDNDATGATGADEKSGLITLRATGGGIGKSSDSCRFASISVGGDAQIIAHVEGFDKGSGKDEARAGLMVRGGFSPNAPMVFLGGGSQKGLSWEVRKTAGTAAAGKTDSSFSFPCWLRLTRSGQTVTASASSDGNNWKQIGTETLPALGTDPEWGLAGYSGSANTFSGLRTYLSAFGPK